MRLAHLGSKGIPSKGGTERVVEALVKQQTAEHDVTVYGSSLVCRSARVHGARVITVPTLKAKHAGPVLLQLACAAHALTQHYDLVHVHGSENAFIVPLLRTLYPVVTTNHGPAYQREKWGGLARRLIRAVEGLSVKGASAATAVAMNQADELTRRYGREVTYVPNGVEASERVDDESARRLLDELGVAPGSYWLFAAARVDPTKGCHTLIEAHAQCGGSSPLLIVGDLYHAPGYEESLRGMAGESVRFVPRLDDKAVLLGLLRQAKLFVFPSTVEAMSMMLLEAVSLGTPTIASDIPENVNVLPPGFPTFSAGDAGDLGRALEAFSARAPNELRDLVASARDWVRERYRWDIIAGQYDRVYRSVLRSRRRDSVGDPTRRL